MAVPAPFEPCTRHCGEKAIFQRRFISVYLELMEVEEGRTKIPQRGIFYEYATTKSNLGAQLLLVQKLRLPICGEALADFNHSWTQLISW